MIRSVDYVLMDPTGNMTLLVATPVPTAAQARAAAQLMEAEPDTEQVGFLSPGGTDAAACLRMAGGEFCGNAAMSAAVLCAMDAHLARADIAIRVSGASTPVTAAVTALPNGEWRGTVAMPRPLLIGAQELPGGGTLPVVRFDGITHVILASEADRAQAEALAPAWCAHLGADALGLMLLDEDAERLTPLVYVPAAGTLVWENSCASGTAAVGAYLADKAGGRAHARLRQPGGTLEIDASGGALLLTGTVKLRKRGSAQITL